MKKNESLWRNSTFEKQVFDIQRQFYKQSRVKISKVWFNLIAQVRLSSIGFIYYAGFDTNRPVIVQVSQLVCQALEVVWCQSGAVLNYVVMGWRYCSLANWLADKKEVIPSKKKKNNYELMCLIKLVQRQHEIKTVSKSLYKQFSPVRNDTLKTLHIKNILTILCVWYLYQRQYQEVGLSDSQHPQICGKSWHWSSSSQWRPKIWV